MDPEIPTHLPGMETTIKIIVPACRSRPVTVDRNPLQQLLVRQQQAKVHDVGNKHFAVLPDGSKYQIVRSKQSGTGGKLRLVVPTSIELSDGTNLASEDEVRWAGKREAKDPDLVTSSYVDAFSFLEEDEAQGRGGLRTPQIGAVHAVLGHWATSSPVPASVVMPTGTGKTEAMLAILAAARLRRLLVLVPSDALRDQLAAKFETMGVLTTFGVIHSRALMPVVGRLKHKIKGVENARQYAQQANVVVATPGALSAFAPHVRSAFLACFSELFIDEAHHVAASTWREIRDSFVGKKVVQFTATPFREDGRRIGGRLIFPFPLREAQRQGYFSRINYISTVSFEEPDVAIAQRAVDKLRDDLKVGFDHILMARVRRIGRSDDLLPIYESLAPDLNPIVIHSRDTKAVQRSAIEALRSRSSRVVICVDMLGEGFDLPQLKVAAIHDPHKSLGVTLQFIGRFARVSDSTIGEATAVVGRPEHSYDPTLRRLYAEDADWNAIIRDLSEVAVEDQQEVSDFEEGFGSLPDEVSLRNLLPKMSTVAYQTQVTQWHPEGISKIFPDDDLLTVPIAVNAAERVAWFVTEETIAVRWGHLQTVAETKFDLYVLYWSKDRQLLYINSSNNRSLHEDLAKSVCGEQVRRITGENVYRVMANIQRLVPTNVGVLDIRNSARRFSMHVGADVIAGFPIAEAQTKTKTNIFANGFEDGQRVTIGASLKGRVWSYRVAPSLKHWVEWCNHVGSKLTDSTISIDEVMKNFLRPKVLTERPDLVAIALEWPWEIYRSTSEETRINIDGSEWPLIDTELRIKTFTAEGPIVFEVVTPSATVEYEIIFSDGKMDFIPHGPEAEVENRQATTSLSAYLKKHGGLTILLEQEAMIHGGFLLKPDRDVPPYDKELLTGLDWTGVNLRKESQGEEKEPTSIQARMIRELVDKGDWDVIVDDDGNGEIADIVALRQVDDALKIRLIHCKYTSAGVPGARVEDLYEVCGQAQKSAAFARNQSYFFTHLLRREQGRKRRHQRTGIVEGTGERLYEIEDEAPLMRAEFTICIAQPGLSKAIASNAQLELLASTELYLRETSNSGLFVYCSN